MRKSPLVVAGLVAAVGVAAPATAAPKAKPKPKPITKTYTATAPVPDPSNYAQQGYSVCAQNVPQSYHTTSFTAPAPGKLSIQVSEFYGDWDLLIMDGSGSELTTGGASDVGTPQTAAVESATVKVKKKGAKYQIVACNWAGSSTAKVTYTFTYL
jgi:type 1 fimbria pilin